MSKRQRFLVSRSGVQRRWRVNTEIRAALEELFAAAPAGTSSLLSLVEIWGLRRGRPIMLEEGPLPIGVFGQWLSFSDHDVLRVRSDGLTWDRTVAHELGHMVLGHRGHTVTEYAREKAEGASTALVALMLQRSCDGTHRWLDEEIAAERFASLLLQRLERLSASGEELPRYRIEKIFS